MTVSADVIAEELARARGKATSSSRTPARAKVSARTPNEPTPARSDHRREEAHSPNAPARATVRKEPTVNTPARAIVSSDSFGETPARAIEPPPTTGCPPARDPNLETIRLLGRTLDDLERVRIETGNRVGAAQRDGIDLPWLDPILDQLAAVEHAAELELKRAWRKHPLAAWAKTIPGAGEVLMGRLIAEIGDPGERTNPAKLLAYCGHGDPARAGKIPKGATQEELFKRGSPHAKKAVWKLAYQFMRTVGTPAIGAPISTRATPETPGSAKTTPNSMVPAPTRARSPYRDVYEARKQATEGKLHERDCHRCGPAGKPALAGSPWSDAHRHADALRIVGKRFLIDLWVASRQSPPNTHVPIAGGAL